jgi:hypothetical protein
MPVVRDVIDFRFGQADLIDFPHLQADRIDF